MNIITVDFETYYDKGLGFRTQTTEEYVKDPRFEVVGVGVKVNEETAEWFTGTHDEVRHYLKKYDWKNSSLLCHNTMFDGSVLAWHFGITPKLYLDTLCIARAVHGVDAGGSLAILADKYGIGIKGTEVEEALGKRRTDFLERDLERYGEYCKNDVELTYKLWTILSKEFPGDELKLIDMTLRMFINPIFHLDDALLAERLEDVKKEKSDMLKSLMDKLECDTEEAVRKKLASNKQFAELLGELGIKVPMKKSPTTGKQTYALAKNDVGFIELSENEDPFIQQLCAVRRGTKSTIEESRIERFIAVGSRNKGRLPIPLKYYGAHTGRWAGSDKVNFQNLPSRDKKKKALKNAVIAPEGYVVINCDSSQIEARVLAWLAGQEDVVQQFANNEDVYSIFATSVYSTKKNKVIITKANPIERFVGKTCVLGLGFGTGALKLQHTLKTHPPGANLPEEECKRIVDLYRDTNDKIVDLWDEGDDAIQDLANGFMREDTDSGASYEAEPYYFGNHQCLLISKDGVQLPNGLYIRYPKLAYNTDESYSRYIYQSRKGPVSIWGGTLVENVVQALARIIVGQQMIKINEKYRVVLTVHDAAVCVVPEDEAEEAKAWIMNIMSIPPDWAVGLPVSCEASYAQSYGEC
jgi:DNA polymerase